MSTPKPPTPAQLYHDALWEAGQGELTTAEAAVALCYANHAHRPPYDRARVVDTRLMQQCKIRSTSSVTRIRDSLVAKGWLAPLHPATGEPLAAAEAKEWQRRRVALGYLLTVPDAPCRASAPARVPQPRRQVATAGQLLLADGTPLPDVPAGQNVLYRHFGEGRVLLYVGVSNSFRTRQKAHARWSPWWPDVRSVEAVPHTSRKAVLAAELEAIRTEAPLHNKPARWQPPDPVLVREQNGGAR